MHFSNLPRTSDQADISLCYGIRENTNKNKLRTQTVLTHKIREHRDMSTIARKSLYSVKTRENTQNPSLSIFYPSCWDLNQ